MTARDGTRAPASTRRIKPAEHAGYTIRRRARFWEVLDGAGELVCLTVYKRGAEEVVRRLCP